MSRHVPVEAVGQVRVFAPTETCQSYRLRWTEPDGTPGDIYSADPGVLMALGGGENEATVLNRY